MLPSNKVIGFSCLVLNFKDISWRLRLLVVHIVKPVFVFVKNSFLLRTEKFVVALAYKFSRPRITFKDRKSTRLNSSHVRSSYAVFCLKKKYKLRGLAKNICYFLQMNHLNLFNGAAYTLIYTLSLHDALPIFSWRLRLLVVHIVKPVFVFVKNSFLLRTEKFVVALAYKFSRPRITFKMKVLVTLKPTARTLIINR